MAVPDIPVDDLAFLASPFLDRSYPGSGGVGESVTNIAPEGSSEVGVITSGVPLVSGRFDFSGANVVPINWTQFAGVNDLLSGTGTLLFWVKLNTSGWANEGRIFAKESGGIGWSVRATGFGGSTADIYLRIATDGTDAAYFLNNVTVVGVWALVGMEFDTDTPGTIAKMWLNGVPQSVSTAATGTGSYQTDAAIDLTIGGAEAGAQMDGQLGACAAYTRALSDGEHVAWHTDTEANQSPIPWWTTIDAFGSSAAIAATNANIDYFNKCNTEAFCDLLPTGDMWPRDEDTTLHKLCTALSIELGRVDAAVNLALDEFYPDTAQQTLEQWERVCQLPDVCDGELADTVAGRQQDVVDAIARDHVLNDDFWTALAGQYGYAAPTFLKRQGFIAGINAAEDPLWSLEALFTVTITFATGAFDVLLECKIRKYWPPYFALEVLFI